MFDLSQGLEAMEAELIDALPVGEGWCYEPKWDGFRCIVIRDNDDVQLHSKSDQPLARYFPEVVERLRSLRQVTFALDGELVVPVHRRLSFDDLLQRIHPAESRVTKLAASHPAVLIVFDMLADGDCDLSASPLRTRREHLEAFASAHLKGEGFRLSPSTESVEVASKWLGGVGGFIDGVIAKRLDQPYRFGERAMQKVKLIRTADCVIGGFRYSQGQKTVGSLLLGLYDTDGFLQHIGFCSGLKTDERITLLDKLSPLIEAPGFTGKKPGGPSRWSTKRSTEWQPLRPELVVEVSYDHFTGGRFRHGTRIVRWRPDKAPSSCTMDQIADPSEAAAKLLHL